MKHACRECPPSPASSVGRCRNAGVAREGSVEAPRRWRRCRRRLPGGSVRTGRAAVEAVGGDGHVGVVVVARPRRDERPRQDRWRGERRVPSERSAPARQDFGLRGASTSSRRAKGQAVSLRWRARRALDQLARNQHTGWRSTSVFPFTSGARGVGRHPAIVGIARRPPLPDVLASPPVTAVERARVGLGEDGKKKISRCRRPRCIERRVLVGSRGPPLPPPSAASKPLSIPAMRARRRPRPTDTEAASGGPIVLPSVAGVGRRRRRWPSA